MRSGFVKKHVYSSVEKPEHKIHRKDLRDHLILTKCGNYYKMWKLDPPKGKTSVSAPSPVSLTTS